MERCAPNTASRRWLTGSTARGLAKWLIVKPYYALFGRLVRTVGYRTICFETQYRNVPKSFLITFPKQQNKHGQIMDLEVKKKTNRSCLLAGIDCPSRHK